MTQQLIAALLLNFGAAVGAVTARTPRYNYSRVTRMAGGLLMLAGLFAAFVSIYLFIASQGLWYGLAYWFGSALIFVTLNNNRAMLDGLRTLLGLGALTAGAALFIRSML